MFLKRVFVLALLSWIFLAAPGFSDDHDHAAHSASLEQFQEMSAQERHDLVLEAFQYRLRHSSNLFYKSESIVRNQIHHNGKFGEVTWAGIRYRHQRWRLGASYRLDTNNYGSPKEPGKQNQLVILNHNAANGTNRQLCKLGEGTFVARIDTVEDRTRLSDRYQYWLDGERVPDSDYLFRYLVNHESKFTLEVHSKTSLVVLTVPWYPYHSPNHSLGDYKVWLDPARGFLPVNGVARWSSGPEDWRSEEFEVLEADLVEDVWMPVQLRLIVHSSSFDNPAKAEVCDVSIHEIKHGNVTQDDVALPFPEGTQVFDTISGTSYKTGRAG